MCRKTNKLNLIRRLVGAATVGIALFLASGESSFAASVFDISFSSTLPASITFPGGEAVSAIDLQATVSGSSSPYTVTTLTGDIDIGGTNYAVSLIAPGGFALNDNLLSYPTTPYFDFDGISFSAGGNVLNITNDGFDNIVTNLGVGDINDLSVVEVAAVPETSTWAMMLLGFAGIGFVGYRRRKTGKALIAA